jgi:hypothetical protein
MDHKQWLVVSWGSLAWLLVAITRALALDVAKVASTTNSEHTLVRLGQARFRTDSCLNIILSVRTQTGHDCLWATWWKIHEEVGTC